MIMYADRYIDAYLFEEGEPPDVDILTPGLVMSTPLNEMLVLKKFRQRFTHTAVKGVMAWYGELRNRELKDSYLDEEDFQLVGAYFLDEDKKPKLHKLTELCKSCMYYPQLLLGQCGRLSNVVQDANTVFSAGRSYKCRILNEFPREWRSSFERNEYRNKAMSTLKESVKKLEGDAGEQDWGMKEEEIEEVWR